MDFVRDSSLVSAKWSCSGLAPLESILWEVYRVNSDNSRDLMTSKELNGDIVLSYAAVTTRDTERYISRITATDVAGNVGVYDSDGFRVDATPPETTDVEITSAEFGRFLTETEHISAAWGCSDAQSNATNAWRLVSSPLLEPETEFVPVDEDSFTNVSVALEHGRGYHVEVLCTNGAGLTVSRVSKQVVVETTQPLCGLPVVSCRYPAGFAQQAGFPQYVTDASCTVEFPDEMMHDPESGVVRATVRLGNATHMLVTETLEDSLDEFSFHATGLTLYNGSSYFASVSCENGAGMSGASESNKFRVRLGRLIAGYVDDGPQKAAINVTDVDFSTHPRAVLTSFSGFYHQEMPNLRYEWSVGTKRGVDDVKAWTWVDSYHLGTSDIYAYDLNLPEAVKL
jgi:hypothetical protein